MKNKQVICRVLALLLAVALLSGFAVPVFAAGTAQITFGQVCGKQGEQVTVPVTIVNNPGIASFRFRITYDTEMLRFVSAQKAGIMTGGTLSAAYQTQKEELAITWFDVKNMTGDDVIFNLFFEIAEDAEGVYPLEISYLPEDIVNATWQQVDCQVSNGCIQMGNNISGTVTSFGSADGEVTVRLMRDDQEVARTVTRNGTYQLSQISAGDYRLLISKQNHVTRGYGLTVNGEDMIQDAKIHLIGDVDGNGRVNVGDTAKIYSYLKRTILINDEYMLLCADVDGNGKINVGDTARVYAHIKTVNPLWR